jgi:hypothetical protein
MYVPFMTLEIHTALVKEIDAFLCRTGMSPSYFGKVATGNSEVVPRLKAGRTITGMTEQKIRDFISSRSSAGSGVAA